MERLKDNPSLHMFVISFLVLFFELVCIRWFPAQIRHLGYFTNYILMAAFLGIGIGCLWGRKGKNLLAGFTPVLILVMLLLHFFQIQITIPMDEVVYFQGQKSDMAPVEPFYMIPIIFFMVTLLFVLLASPMGKLFDEMKPLLAYKANILGSLAGIAAFTLLSYLKAPPYLWMIFFYCLFPLLLLQKKKLAIGLQVVLAIPVILMFFVASKDSIWSFYYKIDPRPLVDPSDRSVYYDVWVNNTGHQMLIPAKYVDQEPMYGEIYRHYSPAELKEMLIVGGGGGRDTSYNLSKGIESIDVVEIDPVLLEFGKTLHPEKPYLDARTEIYNNDARTFMKKQERHYDCIIFALPDSLVLSSSYANLRLESYLFTIESFQEAQRLLKEDGILVLYNYFRKPWLINKLASMLEEVFGYPPAVFRYSNTMACLITGPGSRRLAATSDIGEKILPATDDWPFLYLKKPSFPGIYLKVLISIIVITLIFYLLSPRPQSRSFDWAFFFLGAAFLLLETKCIVNFSLLFGSTWMVNSVVFFVILGLVLLAIFITNKFAIKNRNYLYIILLATIAINYFIPLKSFLGSHLVVQNIIAPIFYLLPIFFANLVFTYNFKDADEAAIAYTSNMLGAILGGVCEYSSMVMGYNNLLIGVFFFYLIAFYLFKKR